MEERKKTNLDLFVEYLKEMKKKENKKLKKII